MALGHFLLPLVLVGGVASGGAATFLFKKEYDGDANTITIYKRTGGGHLKLGGPEKEELPLSSTSFLVIDKDGWRHNIDNQNGSSFRLTTGNYTRDVSEQKDWANVLREEEFGDDGRESKHRNPVVPKEKKGNNKFHGDLTIYVGGATCADINRKFSDLKHKSLQEGQENFLPFFEKNSNTERIDENHLSLVMWECQNAENKNSDKEFLKDLKEALPNSPSSVGENHLYFVL
ncbi:hypothetical protein [Mycoplasma suis]|uniref:Uncharacterized protein n=1 Tax=Mycoplasma suis (strain Illinois) TaxID=768700 RepID=F0QQU4_MYCSL|nr:hypothetical protein [Mycoplasma suis]ADX97864.1 hypothetical protein MSU_0322 [Mycoplasma suis str. Illinois]